MDLFEDLCPICFESLDNSANTESLLCNHKLHKLCAKKLIVSDCPSRDKCPLCRHPIYTEYYTIGIFGFTIILMINTIIIFFISLCAYAIYEIIDFIICFFI